MKLSSSGFGEIDSGGDRLPRAAFMELLVLVMQMVNTPTPGIHEEVAHCGKLKAQLMCNGQLHFFAWPPIFLEDGNKCASLQVSKHKTLLFRKCAALL